MKTYESAIYSIVNDNDVIFSNLMSFSIAYVVMGLNRGSKQPDAGMQSKKYRNGKLLA